MNMEDSSFDEKIRQLRVNKKFAPSRIARDIGMTNEFVCFRLGKMGLPMIRMNKCESFEGLKLAYLNGKSYSEMTKEFKIGGSAINNWAKKWGLPRRHRLLPSDEILLNDYVGNQLTCAEIAKKYGCADCSVSVHLQKLGVSRSLTEARAVHRQRVLKEKGLPYMLDAQGYPTIPVPDGFRGCGRADSGMLRLHDLEMMKHLGRPIQKGENIHHINFDKMDSRIENLHLCASISEHRRVHHSLEKVGADLFKKGIVEFNGTSYVINEEKLAEYLASIEHSEIPDPIPHFKDSE